MLGLRLGFVLIPVGGDLISSRCAYALSAVPFAVSFVLLPLALVDPGRAIGNFAFFALVWRSSPGKPRAVFEFLNASTCILCYAGGWSELARGCAGISHSVADSPGPHRCVYLSFFDCRKLFGQSC